MRFKTYWLKKTSLLLLFFVITSSFSQNLDIDVLRDLNGNRNRTLDPLLKGVTNSVTPIVITTPIILYSVGLIMKDSTVKKKALFIGQTVIVSGFITFALKRTVNRDRPYITYSEIDQITSSSGSSFPSGHTSLAFSTATSLTMAYPKWYVIVPSFAWAATVGYSRMALGVHYPTDVIAGAIIGSGSAYLTYKVNKWINKKEFKKIPKLWD